MPGSGRETPPGRRGAHARLGHEYANEPRGAGPTRLVLRFRATAHTHLLAEKPRKTRTTWGLQGSKIRPLRGSTSPAFSRERNTGTEHELPSC